MNRSIYYSSPHRCNYKTILLFQPPLTKEERPFVGTWALSIVTPPFLTPLDVFLDTLRFKSCLMHDPSIRARSTVVCILRFFLKFFFCPFENNQTKRRDKSKWIFYKFYFYSIYIKLSVRKEKLNESSRQWRFEKLIFPRISCSSYSKDFFFLLHFLGYNCRFNFYSKNKMENIDSSIVYDLIFTLLRLLSLLY